MSMAGPASWPVIAGPGLADLAPAVAALCRRAERRARELWEPQDAWMLAEDHLGAAHRALGLPERRPWLALLDAETLHLIHVAEALGLYAPEAAP